MVVVEDENEEYSDNFQQESMGQEIKEVDHDEDIINSFERAVEETKLQSNAAVVS